jgi:hypothetical protein
MGVPCDSRAAAHRALLNALALPLSFRDAIKAAERLVLADAQGDEPVFGHPAHRRFGPHQLEQRVTPGNQTGEPLRIEPLVRRLMPYTMSSCRSDE